MGQDIANPNFHNVTDGDNMPHYHTHMRLHAPKSVDQVLTATINNYLRHTPLSEPRYGSALSATDQLRCGKTSEE